MKLSVALRWVTGELKSSTSSAEAEAETLVLWALGFPERHVLFTQSDQTLHSDQLSKLNQAIAKRKQGTPLQHLTGVQVFLEHEYAVSPEVLIPRPETEMLVSYAIDDLTDRGFASRACLGFELGLGSGVISIELLAKFSKLRMTASEASAGALTIAALNQSRILGESSRDRLTIVPVSDPLWVWQPFSASGRADFFISNPPYVSQTDPIETSVQKYEPSTALFPPRDPLYFYEQIAMGLRDHLNPGGCAYLEISEFRSAEIASLFEAQGWVIEVLPDLNERDRILVVRPRP